MRSALVSDCALLFVFDYQELEEWWKCHFYAMLCTLCLGKQFN